MPLNDEHRESIKGKYGADISNLGDCRWGGSCHAAAFLEKFIENDRPWAHLDIAGPVTFGKSENSDATGFGAKLLLSFIASLSAETEEIKEVKGETKAKVKYSELLGLPKYVITPQKEMTPEEEVEFKKK
jgi:hypothetical protein